MQFIAWPPFCVAVAPIQMKSSFANQAGPIKPAASKKDAKSDAKSDRKQDHDAIYLIEDNGEPGGARTRDHRIKSAMLYQLSYRLSREKEKKRLTEKKDCKRPLLFRLAWGFLSPHCYNFSR
jgi:hypothetical protein